MTELETVDVDHDRGFRVMVFCLSADRQWIDRGTGYLQEVGRGTDQTSFLVHSEETGKLLLRHVVTGDIEYSKQGNSIITWFDREADVDLALSFQESSACSVVWNKVQIAMLEAHSQGMSVMDSSVVTSINLDTDSGILSNGYSTGVDDIPVELPLPTLDSLGKIKELLLDATVSRKSALASAASDYKWFTALYEVIDQSIDLEHFESLFQLFSIVKSMFLLNVVPLIDQMTSVDVIDKTIEILEYDPELVRPGQDPGIVDFSRHRKAIESARFRDVVPIGNPAILQSIRQNYVITYIRDVFMLRHLDDALSTTLSSMLFFNVVNIMTSLSQDSSFLDRLFAKLQLASCVNPTQDTLDLFKFVQEMVNLSKSIQIRNEFFAKLSQRGLVSHLARCLNEWRSGSHDPSSFGHKIALMIVDVLHIFAVHDPHLIRASMLAEGPSSVLMSAFIGAITTTSPHIESGIQAQITEILTTLLSPESLEFCNQKAFLETCIEPHLDHVIRCVSDFEKSRLSSVCQSAQFLTYCIREHGATLAHVLRRHRWQRAALGLLSCRSQMTVMLSGVRLVRAACQILLTQQSCDDLKDWKAIMKSCIDVFIHNGLQRYNLLNSALIELFEFIRANNIKGLVSYLADEELGRIASVTYVSVFQRLRSLDEQNRDAVAAESAMTDTTPVGAYSESRAQFRELQEEEEYFQSSSSAVAERAEASLPLSPTLGNDPEPEFIDRKAFSSDENTSDQSTDFLSAVRKRKTPPRRSGSFARTTGPSLAFRIMSSTYADDDEDADQKRKIRPVNRNHEDAIVSTPAATGDADRGSTPSTADGNLPYAVSAEVRP
ncbi:unnamed protein product (mitochondrion) [Plasmodiophora brassicae]|uniref:Uncharacterized protein n=1 Tax=Plasmodiophora brassicae TaxID=37360 RepID=A0A0G4ILC5_PLABS|nr:hypothetical protein PBRA_004668 [Plasmodiophora brassicae]SPQ93475.1 unnamed protein product [Plasmodiophora brassicae]